VPRTNPRKGTRAFQWLLRYNLVRAALKIYFIRQQTNFSTSLFKHATLCARLKTRRNSTSSELCPCIGPVPTRATEVPSSTARALLPVASGSYGLLCTSGFHRPLDLCEGRRPTKLEAGGNQTTPSRPPGTAFLLANVLRGPSRQPFLRLASSSP
jgi:hypothetical protein